MSSRTRPTQSRSEKRTKRRSSVADRAAAKPLTLGEFSAALARLARWEARPFIAVAVSGGADSLALAILADRWARERGGEICAVTVDHRLRPESGAEISRLNGWLSARAIRHEILNWSGEKPASGIQEAARTARYVLLDNWCGAHGCLHMLTAHHREDQAETYLIRCRARSGANGLAGMSAIRELVNCRVLRPLLGVAKARLEAFLDAERQPFITDPSNRNPVFERSRLRSEGVLPLGAELDTLLSKMRTLACGRRVNESRRHGLLARAVILHPAGFAVLDPTLLSRAPCDVAEGVIAAVVSTIGGKLYPPRRERIARLRGMLGGGPLRHAHTLGGCILIPWRGRILALRELAAAATPVTLGPGECCSWDQRYSLALATAAKERSTVGYLGPAGVVGLHRRFEEPASCQLPRVIYPTLPAIWDKRGLAAVPSLGYQREHGMVIPEVRFHPSNPLTRAGFTVV
jgi:tRNA(Ile)-lysidine synthase